MGDKLQKNRLTELAVLIELTPVEPGGAARELRQAAFHDRWVVGDHNVYGLGASINGVGGKSMTTLIEMPDAAARFIRDAAEGLWSDAKVIAETRQADTEPEDDDEYDDGKVIREDEGRYLHDGCDVRHKTERAAENLIAADAVSAAGVDVVNGPPAAQTRLADPEILGDLRHRLLTSTNKVHGTTPELRRLRCRHSGLLPETIIASEQVSGKAGQAPFDHPMTLRVGAEHRGLDEASVGQGANPVKARSVQRSCNTTTANNRRSQRDQPVRGVAPTPRRRGGEAPGRTPAADGDQPELTLPGCRSAT
ncbi:MAG: hypothetical protein M3N95_06310 [Actinomycetota bacterium]|nr:hypothetical protein [Actinomycetota bacterium]